MEELLFLTEAFNRNRIKTNFSSFFNALEKDITDDIIDIFKNFIDNIIQKIIEKKFEMILNNNLIVDVNTESFIQEFPTIYMEKVLSELKNHFNKIYEINNNLDLTRPIIFETINTLKHFNFGSDESDYDLSIEFGSNFYKMINAFALLYYLKIIIKKNNLTNLNSQLNALEHRVYKKDYNIKDDVFNLIDNIIKTRKLKKESKVSNFLVFKNENIEVYKVDSSREACILLGKGTDWCVANTHTDIHYKEYSSYGDMYVFIFKKLKNKFDESGPEKALLTLVNKNREANTDPFIVELFQKIAKNEFKITKEIVDHEGNYMTDLFISLIKNDDFKKLMNMEDYHEQEKKDRQLALSYIVEIFEETLKNNLIDLSKYYSKENFNILKIFKNDPHSDKFFNDVRESFAPIMIKFYHNIFNINEVKKRLEGKVSPYFKLIDNIYKYHSWYLDARKFSIETIIEAIGLNGKKLIYSIKDDNFENFIKKVLKFNYHLRDSSNVSFNLLPINESERNKELLNYMFEWPELEKKVFYISYENVKKLIDYLKNTSVFLTNEDEDKKKAIEFFLNDYKLLHKMEEYHYLFNTIKSLINKNHRSDVQFYIDFIKNLNNYPELVVPFFVNEMYFTILNNTEIVNLFNKFFLFFLYQVKMYEKYDQTKSILESFYKNNIEYWASLGFFDGINESNETYEAAQDVAIYAMTKAEAREVESVLFNSYTILKGFFLELLGYINDIVKKR